MTLLGSLDNFYLTKGEQEQSPSRRDGITAAAERELRHYCADVVAEAAVLLRLPQVVAATAQVLVQRFYCKRSLKKFDPKVRGREVGSTGGGVAVVCGCFWAVCSLFAASLAGVAAGWLLVAAACTYQPLGCHQPRSPPFPSALPRW